jgi:hypothetical protein
VGLGVDLDFLGDYGLFDVFDCGGLGVVVSGDEGEGGEGVEREGGWEGWVNDGVVCV